MPLPDLGDLLAELDDDDPLVRLVAAEAVAGDLQRLADRVVGVIVDELRDAGHSWSAIGDHLGITRQAAQQRYTPRWSSLTLSDLVATNRLAHHTERARAALVRAERLATGAGAPAVEPVHLLAAVLDSPGLGRDAARATGADVRRLRAAADRIIGATVPPVDDDVPVSAAVRRCLEATLDETLGLGHNYIGTEHQLLGVLHDGDVAALAARHRLDLDAARDEVSRLLAAAPPPPRRRGGG
jgi:hypothetical protein